MAAHIFLSATSWRNAVASAATSRDGTSSRFFSRSPIWPGREWCRLQPTAPTAAPRSPPLAALRNGWRGRRCRPPPATSDTVAQTQQTQPIARPTPRKTAAMSGPRSDARRSPTTHNSPSGTPGSARNSSGSRPLPTEIRLRAIPHRRASIASACDTVKEISVAQRPTSRSKVNTNARQIKPG